MHPPNSILELPSDQLWYKPPSLQNKKRHSKLWSSKRLRVNENNFEIIGGKDGKISLKRVVRVGRMALEESESLCFEVSNGVFEYRFGTIGWYMESATSRWSFACPDDQTCQRWLRWVQDNVKYTSIPPTDKAAMGMVTSNLIKRAADVLNDDDQQSDASAPPISNPSPADTPREHVRTLSAPLSTIETPPRNSETSSGDVISITPSRGAYASYSHGFGRGRRSNYTHTHTDATQAPHGFSSPRGRGIPFTRTRSDDNSSTHSIPMSYVMTPLSPYDSVPYAASVSGQSDILDEPVVTVM